MKRFIALSVVVLAMPMSVAAAANPHPVGRSIGCTDDVDTAERLVLRVEGEKATGHYALPASKPKGLVVFAHGYGHTSYSWKDHMRTAAEHGLIAVAMDYRGTEISPDSNGDGLPESRGWNVTAGAEDSIAAAQLFESACPTIQDITIFGVSMGGNTAGLVVAEQGARGITDSEGEPLFDYWFSIEAATNLIETYHESRLAGSISETAVRAQEDIEAETGGSFEEVPDEYRKRTVIARLGDIQAAGLKGTVLVHGIDDGLVPYNQSREMATGLAISQIPTHYITIGERSEESEKETTLTGYAGDQLQDDYRSPFAGHASEKSKTHIVMVTSFERLYALYDDGVVPPPYSETLVNG